MSTETGTGLSEGRVGRYVLEDLVAETAGSQLWRASDPALGRPVGARLIALTSPRIPAICSAAKAAAKVHDRRIVQVLDVIETQHHLAVITEWVGGRPWSELLAEAEEDTQAVIVAYEVARAIQAAHAQGVTHGRIRPSSVIITDTDEVRVRGLGVDAALYGVAPGEDAVAADLHGIGAILYVGLTRHWPDPQPRAPDFDGLPVVGPVGRRLPSAREVTSGVPRYLSDLASACLLPQVRPRTRRRIPDSDHAVSALARGVERATGASPDPTDGDDPAASATDRLIRRVASVVIIGITLAAGLLFAGSLIDRGVEPTGSAATPPAGSSPSASSEFAPEALPIASVVDFDPQGQDKHENPDLVPLAADGDVRTAWETVRYKTSAMSPKQGTGLLVDLGLSRPISAVRLQFLGSGTDVEIRIADALGTEADDYELLAGAVAAGEEITLRTPIPVQTRYVLVWLTNLPFQDNTYLGGIRELQVLG